MFYAYTVKGTWILFQFLFLMKKKKNLCQNNSI